jgi:TonB family protein
MRASSLPGYGFTYAVRLKGRFVQFWIPLAVVAALCASCANHELVAGARVSNPPAVMLATGRPTTTASPFMLGASTSAEATRAPPRVVTAAVESAASLAMIELPLNEKRYTYAKYVSGMHVRIHPFFADVFLPAFEKAHAAPSNSPQALSAVLEIVVNSDGSLRAIAIRKSSGVSTFDIGVLDAVQRASPFEVPPLAVRSHDGFFYVEWSFNSDSTQACATMNVRPLLLGNPLGARAVDVVNSPHFPGENRTVP